MEASLSLLAVLNLPGSAQALLPALALVGGLDLRAGKHLDIRLVQADYLPTFFGSTRQDNLRLSFGVVFRR